MLMFKKSCGALAGFTVAALSGLCATSAAAAGLYAAAPPPNSVYVRIVAAADVTQASVGVKRLSAASGAASPYVVLPAGDAVVAAGSAKAAKPFAGGKYYSVVLGPGGRINVLEDPLMTSHVKATISFYNLTARPNLELRTADGKAVVVAATAPGKEGSRQVNGATAAFGVFGGGVSLAATAPQAIVRGVNYSAVATESAGKVRVVWARAETK